MKVLKEKHKLKILHLEDSSRDAEIIQESLKEAGFDLEIDCTMTEKEFVSLLSRSTYDIILADFKLPGFDAFGALRHVMEMCPAVPFICVSGTIGEESAVELLKQGAVDYIMKDRLARLPAAIEHALDEAKEKDLRKRAEDSLRLEYSRQKKFVDSNIVGVVIAAADGKILEVNDYYLNMLGFTRREFESGKINWRAITPTESLPADEKAIRELRERGTCTPYEKEYRRKDGTIVPVFLADTLLPGPEEEIAAFVLDITERKRAEESLRKSEAQLRAVLDATRFPVALVDIEDNNIEYWSRSALALFGHTAPTAEQWYQKAYPDPDYRCEVIARWKKSLEKAKLSAQAVNAGEYRVTCRDGSVRICELYAAFLTDRLIVTFNDITERKLSEDMLKQSEARYRLLAEHMKDTVWLMDMDLRTTYISPSVEKLRGFTLEELRQLPLDRQVAPASFQLAKKAFSEELPKTAADPAYNINRTLELEFYRKDGTTYWSETTYSLIRDNKGNPASILGEGRNITERKRAEEELRESEQRFRSLYENSTIGLYRTTPDGKIILANPTLVKMLGYSSFEELAARNLEEEGFEPTYERKQFVEQIEINGEVHGLESVWTCNDGSTVYIRESARAIRDPNGKTIYYDGSVEDISERKLAEMTSRKAEEALEQEHILLRTLIDNLPDAVYVKDSAMRKILVNKADLVNIGKSESEVIGKNDDELFPADVAAHFIQDDKIVLEKGQSIIDREELLINEKGDKKWLLTSKLPLRNKDGHITRLIGIGHDITERKRKDEEIVKLNRLYALLSNINQLIVRESDRQTLLNEMCNIAVLDGEFQMAWVGIVDPETNSFQPVASAGKASGQRNKLQSSLVQITAGREPLWRTLFDGQIIISNDIELDDRLISQRDKLLVIGCCSLAAFPLHIDDQIIGVVNFYSNTKDFFNEEELKLLEELAMDISYALHSLDLEDQRTYAEKEMRESENKYRRIFENVQDVYYEALIDGTILEISPSIEAITKKQYKRNELIGTSMHDYYLNIEERQTFHSALQRQGIVSDYEITLKNRDGSHIPCSISAKLQYNAQGDPEKIIGSISDITERKLYHNQLMQTQKVQSIGTLAGGIAHDFNNILGIILAFTSILERSKLDEEKILKSTTAITQAVSRGAALVRQIMTFARQTGVSMKPLRITDLIRELVVMLKETFPEIIEFQIGLEKNIPIINADQTQMHQVLLNICVNARDAMPKGGIISIEVKTIASETLVKQFPETVKGRYVSIRISDTGIGMDEETRIRIFDPFFTTKELGKGTGLGLSVVHGVIQEHYGFISVESEIGHGTTFNLYIPVPQEEKIQDIENVKTEAKQGGTETILFVEDEQLLREIVQSTLESMGYQVLTAANGKDAVEIYKNNFKDIALVLTDMGLPKLLGADVFAVLKEINRDVKVIFASGFISLETRSELLKQGAKGFILKPYNLNEMLQMVREVLNEDTKLSK